MERISSIHPPSVYAATQYAVPAAVFFSLADASVGAEAFAPPDLIPMALHTIGCPSLGGESNTSCLFLRDKYRAELEKAKINYAAIQRVAVAIIRRCEGDLNFGIPLKEAVQEFCAEGGSANNPLHQKQQIHRKQQNHASLGDLNLEAEALRQLRSIPSQVKHLNEDTDLFQFPHRSITELLVADWIISSKERGIDEEFDYKESFPGVSARILGPVALCVFHLLAEQRSKEGTPQTFLQWTTAEFLKWKCSMDKVVVGFFRQLFHDDRWPKAFRDSAAWNVGASTENFQEMVHMRTYCVVSEKKEHPNRAYGECDGMGNIANVMIRHGHFGRGRIMWEEVLKYCPNTPRQLGFALWGFCGMTIVYGAASPDFELWTNRLEENCNAALAKHGPRSNVTLLPQELLAFRWAVSNPRNERALSLLKEVIQISEKKLGASSRQVMNMRTTLAQVLLLRGEPAAAIMHAEAAIRCQAIRELGFHLRPALVICGMALLSDLGICHTQRCIESSRSTRSNTGDVPEDPVLRERHSKGVLRLQQAIATPIEGMHFSTTQAHAHFLLGRHLESRGEVDKAFAEYRSALHHIMGVIQDKDTIETQSLEGKESNDNFFNSALPVHPYLRRVLRSVLRTFQEEDEKDDSFLSKEWILSELERIALEDCSTFGMLTGNNEEQDHWPWLEVAGLPRPFSDDTGSQ